MRQARNQVASLEALSKDQRANNRRHGRLRCELLTCGLGQVLDFSASGMRVAHRGRMELKEGESICLHLQVLHISQIVQARVVHVRKSGFRRHEVGLEFIEVTPEVSAGLLSIVRLAVSSLTVAHHDAPTP